MDTERRSKVGQASVGSGVSRSESFISDQGTLGARNAGRRPADRISAVRRRGDLADYTPLIRPTG